ncbi:MAG: type I restriction endonuclease, partial [Phycisphaerales bacterium]
MSFTDRIASVAQRAGQMADRLETEEATKNALVMPFIQALGYDVFNPDEVVPEFTADVGTKKGEKVDYAIMRDGHVIMLFECKRAGTSLAEAEMSQLYRYFGVTEARIGILTNGVQYRFFSDLEEPNKMDHRPFLVADVRRLRDRVLDELRKLTRDGFDLDQMLDAASDLKNLGQIRTHLTAQYDEPDEEFVKLFFTATNPGRQFRAGVRENFAELVRQAFHGFVNDKVSDRLRAALEREAPPQSSETESGSAPDDTSDGIVTTAE